MRIAVVIPSYKVKRHVMSVISKIGPTITDIFVVDDKCPEESGRFVEENCKDPRVKVIYNSQNQGVGGATIAGYYAAYESGAEIVIKIDGDDQMDPTLIPDFTRPIINGLADYTKGNRFFNIEDLKKMPKIRLFGNAALSFLNKFSSGYYSIFDPTNGYTALRTSFVPLLSLDKVSKRYFFESDLLMRLNLTNAYVIDIPMKAVYGDEVSNLKIHKIIVPFFLGHIRNFLKRITYKYYIRDFSIASLELLIGTIALSFGVVFGSLNWLQSINEGTTATAGTVMLAALPIIVGCQLVLAFLNYDINSGRK